MVTELDIRHLPGSAELFKATRKLDVSVWYGTSANLGEVGKGEIWKHRF